MPNPRSTTAYPVQWALTGRAALALLFGLSEGAMLFFAFWLPRITAAMMATLFTGFALLDGLVALATGDAGVGVLQVEYPGYGRSGGSPSDDSLTAALAAAYDWAASDARIDARRIAGYGRSLGGGAIAQLAARRNLAALVLESTFENFEEVVMAYGVPRYLLINHFDTRGVLAKYDGPVLLLHGTLDRTFDARNARALAAIARRATLHLETCGHNDCPPRWDLVLGFLATNGVIGKPKEDP